MKAPESSNHPRHALDEDIHHPVRLSLLAILARADRVDFAFLRDHLEVSDSNLSRHLSALEELGYVQIDKGFVGKRPRTWLSLTPEGRIAFDHHVRLLREIVEGSASAPTA